MKLHEEISRMKSMMNIFESSQIPTNILFEGETKNTFGKKIKIMGLDENLIGYANVVSFDNGWELDYDIPRLYEEKSWCKKNCDENFFNRDNTTYIYDVYVNENFRGNGFGKQIMNLAHDVSKQEGFNYCTLITHRENNTAQNLYKNLGYDLHYSDDVKDFYFLEL